MRHTSPLNTLNNPFTLLCRIVCENSIYLIVSDRKFLTLSLTIGSFIISLIDGLLTGSTYKRRVIKFFISLEKCVGIGVNYPLTILRARK